MISKILLDRIPLHCGPTSRSNPGTDNTIPLRRTGTLSTCKMASEDNAEPPCKNAITPLRAPSGSGTIKTGKAMGIMPYSAHFSHSTARGQRSINK